MGGALVEDTEEAEETLAGDEVERAPGMGGVFVVVVSGGALC
jgi:hypothetical protein